MESIAIIGVGALGKRHLQSMVELQDQYQIYAVEINEEIIKQLTTEFPKVNFIKTVEELPNELEAVVIATNSNIRRLLFEQLINHSTVKNIIFEKVLFQKEEDYYFVENKLNELNIKAWVNCARREWDSYKSFKMELNEFNELYISAIGGQWGIGCNAIHILDLIEYLSGSEIETLDISKLENRLIESKRKGFYEFFGTISGVSGKCKNFNITCIDESALPFRIEITTEKSRYMIDEGNNYLLVSDEESEWQWKRMDFKQVYQSQMTGRVIKSIIDNGTCNLSDYESSMKLHLKYILPLIEFFKANGMEENLCPIT
ncbi:MAG: hypothetical protein E7Z80_06525 [Methanobrevibacter thaueri]|nr:hypothetical protein [Methanobrevibacter thaueri]